MLLHSEVQSAGLNLIAASSLHIIEPILNTSLELQAIGRIHRIGQTAETHVFCYYVKDTVEERILAVNAYKGQSLYLEGHHSSLASASWEAGDHETADGKQTSKMAASASAQDAKNWAGLGRTKSAGSSGTMRGDYTTNDAELLACLFGAHLNRFAAGCEPRLSRTKANDTKPCHQPLANGNGPALITVTPPSDLGAPEPAESVNNEEVQRASLRKARLAALERRAADGRT
jgi:E3 ubiquitin-protein ligase SHPRH